MSEVLAVSKDLILGIHSILAALNNPRRSGFEIFGTQEAFQAMREHADYKKENFLKAKVTTLASAHAFQEKSKQLFKEVSRDYVRIPAQVCMTAETLGFKTPDWLYKEVACGEITSLICLDQVTDTMNGAAILRTASFYGVQAVVLAQKGIFGLSPSFFRVASGAIEDVPIVQCSSLPRIISKLKDLKVKCIGLDEHEARSASSLQKELEGNTSALCLVLGAEDKGMSHAVKRIVEYKIQLPSRGKIKSLNVSAAAAVAMEKFFGENSVENEKGT